MDSSELPAGWAVARLNEAVDRIVGGGTPSKSIPEYFDGSIPLMTVKDMKVSRPSQTGFNITKAALENSSAKVVPADTIIIATRMGLGKVVRPKMDTAINQDLKALFPSEATDKSFLEWWLHSVADKIEGMGTGTTVKGVRLNEVKALEIPLAPLPEQQRIVEKIETLFAELDKGEEALREVQKLLARYRQSVLKAAVTGTLTADWRAANDPPKETGHDLLYVVKAERVKRGRRKQPMAPKIDQQLELPSSWAWSSLDELLYDGPTNGVSPKQADAGGTPSFKLTATTSGRFIINDDTVKQVNIEPEADSKFWLKAGDVLIQRGNTIEYVGTAAAFPGPDDQYIYPDLMMRVRFTHEMLADWAVAWINFEYAKRHFRSLATGTAGNMPKINGTTLKSLAVPVPPLAEIGELLRRLDDNLSKVDPIEAWCETELKRSAALRQSMLKDAFSGKLVPQNPADEPAKKLLDRIRAARAEKPRAKRKKAAA